MLATLAIVVLLILLLILWLLKLRRATVVRTPTPVSQYSIPQYSIPAVCHQTWITRHLPREVSDLVSRNKTINPEMTFLLYDDSDVKRFIRDRLPSDVFRAFLRIDPRLGAQKADFFRYCVLLVEGGVYLDIKSELLRNLFRDIVQPTDECILDFRRYDWEPYRQRLNFGTHEQWLLMAMPRHPYFIEVVNILVRDVFAKDPCHSIGIWNDTSPNTTNMKQVVLRQTGPDLLAVAIHKSIILGDVRHRETDLISITRRDAVDRKTLYGKVPHYSQIQLKQHSEIKQN